MSKYERWLIDEMYGKLRDTANFIKQKSLYDGDEFSLQESSIRELLNRIDKEREEDYEH